VRGVSTVYHRSTAGKLASLLLCFEDRPSNFRVLMCLGNGILDVHGTSPDLEELM